MTRHSPQDAGAAGRLCTCPRHTWAPGSRVRWDQASCPPPPARLTASSSTAFSVRLPLHSPSRDTRPSPGEDCRLELPVSPGAPRSPPKPCSSHLATAPSCSPHRAPPFLTVSSTAPREAVSPTPTGRTGTGPHLARTLPFPGAQGERGGRHPDRALLNQRSVFRPRFQQGSVEQRRISDGSKVTA